MLSDEVIDFLAAVEYQTNIRYTGVWAVLEKASEEVDIRSTQLAAVLVALAQIGPENLNQHQVRADDE